jgi:hypothetical protein
MLAESWLTISTKGDSLGFKEHKSLQETLEPDRAFCEQLHPESDDEIS